MDCNCYKPTALDNNPPFFLPLTDSSIKSVTANQNFTIGQEETISDSLLEKFNNMSCNNSINDRIIIRVTVIKEKISKVRKNSIAGGSHHHSNSFNDGRNRKYLTLNTIKDRQQYKKSFLSRSQESILPHHFSNASINTAAGNHSNSRIRMDDVDVGVDATADDIKRDSAVNSDYTLGISIVQGSDNNVYVKDLMKNGPGDKNGIQIGDQVR